MKKVIFILGALILTCGLAMAQYNDAKTCQIGKKNVIKVEQIGHENEVRMHQYGFENWARVMQKGHGNEVKSMQRGTDHGLIVKQFGVHNEVDIKQGRRWWLCGPCNEGLFIKVIQKGFFNEADIDQEGKGSEIYVEQISKKYKKGRCHKNNEVDLEQTWGCVKICCDKLWGCSDNLMDVYQEGMNLYVEATQEGRGNKLFTEQYGYGHDIETYQLGIRNKATIIQKNFKKPCHR